MSSGQALQALVFGASGVSGYAILKELLKYPAPNTFSRIIGLTNRGLNREIAQLPEDHRIELYSDLDLTQRNQTLLHLQHIPGIDKTTHVFFTAYTGHGKPYKELKQINTEILTNALGTCEIVCPEMKFFTLQTGGKVISPRTRTGCHKTEAFLTGLRRGICVRRRPIQSATQGGYAACARTLEGEYLLLRAVRHHEASVKRQAVDVL